MADFQYHNEARRKARVLERKLAAQLAMAAESGNQKSFTDPSSGIGGGEAAYRPPSVYSHSPQDFRMSPEFNAQDIIQELSGPRGHARTSSLTPSGGRPASRPPSYPTPAITPMLDNLHGGCITPSPTPPLLDARAPTFEDIMGDQKELYELFDTALDWKY